jgi:hypothetical protein
MDHICWKLVTIRPDAGGVATGSSPFTGADPANSRRNRIPHERCFARRVTLDIAQVDMARP